MEAACPYGISIHIGRCEHLSEYACHTNHCACRTDAANLRQPTTPLFLRLARDMIGNSVLVGERGLSVARCGHFGTGVCRWSDRRGGQPPGSTPPGTSRVVGTDERRSSGKCQASNRVMLSRRCSAAISRPVGRRPQRAVRIGRTAAVKRRQRSSSVSPRRVSPLGPSIHIHATNSQATERRCAPDPTLHEPRRDRLHIPVRGLGGCGPRRGPADGGGIRGLQGARPMRWWRRRRTGCHRRR